MEAKLEELRKSEGLEQSIDCLSMHLKNAKTQRLHYHEYIELLYGFSGKADVCIGSSCYTMEEGDLLIINAGEVHTVSSS